MSTPLFFRSLALTLVFALMVPVSLLINASVAHAQVVSGTVIVGNTAPTEIANTVSQKVSAVENTFTAIKSAITAVAAVATQVSTYALMIDKYVLEPIAFVTSGNLLKSITASVIKFVNGQTNGSGKPQFVQNLRGDLQQTGDIQTLAFLIQFGKNSNSPFSSAITSSLRTNYLQTTSLAGFFAANKCTLNQFSPNINSFLAGNWSQGGAGAWLGLTTQNQNNPYLLHQQAQQELALLVQSAVGTQLQQLAYGSGFYSWCSGGDGASATGQSCTDTENSADCPGELVCVGSAGKGTCQVPTADQSDAVSKTTCVNKDGTAGTIKTPGSVIRDQLQKVLGIDIDKLLTVGNISPEINSILGSIGTVMNTINFASALLGGQGSGGLAGVGNTSGSAARSALENYQNSAGYLGLTQSTVLQDQAAALAAGSDMTTRVNQYESAWNTISAATNVASSSVLQLASACSSQASAAQSALQNQIAPVLTKAATASTTITNARAMVAKVQAEANSTDPGAAGAYTADIQTLQAMPPSAADLAQAEQDALALGAALASPDGSLNISSSSSIVDTMNLLAANAQKLLQSCGAPTTP